MSDICSPRGEHHGAIAKEELKPKGDLCEKKTLLFQRKTNCYECAGLSSVHRTTNANWGFSM